MFFLFFFSPLCRLNASRIENDVIPSSNFRAKSNTA